MCSCHESRRWLLYSFCWVPKSTSTVRILSEYNTLGAPYRPHCLRMPGVEPYKQMSQAVLHLFLLKSILLYESSMSTPCP
jgi:hypothetical protein